MIREILRFLATLLRGWQLLILLLAGIINIFAFIKTKNDYKRKREIHPELQEKIRIEMSRTPLMAENTRFEIIVLIATIIVVIVNYFLICLYATNNNGIYPVIIISSFISLILILLYLIITTKLSYILFPIQVVKNTYGNVERQKAPKCEYIIGTKEQLGNVRKHYKFNFYIKSLNCHALMYLLEELTLSDRLHYNEKTRIMEYRYDLKPYGLYQIPEYILEDDIFKETIKVLKETKFIEIYIKNDFLIVEKETTLINYNITDFKRDIEDIKVFYDKLVMILANNRFNTSKEELLKRYEHTLEQREYKKQCEFHELSNLRIPHYEFLIYIFNILTIAYFYQYNHTISLLIVLIFTGLVYLINRYLYNKCSPLINRKVQAILLIIETILVIYLLANSI